jgi:hypothetical protein
MAEQLDAIIRRLSARIKESPEGASQPKGRPSVGRMKKNLGRMQDIRAHFTPAQ